MGQSLSKNYIHITFSTKHREAFITREIENELFSYIGAICKKTDSSPIQVGGHKDHVHILCNLSKKIALMKLVEDVKSGSSKWIKTKGTEFSSFYWQNGYGAFSVNPTQVDVVVAYIRNQAEHHAKKSFKEEYLEFLNKYKVEFDERYIWD